jgi:hypothetical protein
MYLFHRILCNEYPSLFAYLYHLEESEIMELTTRHFQGFDQLDTHFRDFHSKYVVLYRELSLRMDTK